MRGQSLAKVREVKDVGITISSDLKKRKQCTTAVNKILGMINKNTGNLQN
jgi:hypothetical protein